MKKNWEKKSLHFKHQLTLNNINRFRVLLPFMLFLSTFLFIFDIVHYKDGFWEISFAYRIIFFAHLWGIVMISISLIPIFSTRIKKAENVKPVHKIAVNIGISLFVLQLIVITVADIIISHTAAAFIGGLFAIGAIVYMGNRMTIISIIIALIIMTLLILRLEVIMDYNFKTIIANIHIYAFFALLMNRLLFFYLIKNYKNRQIIEKQNQVLENQAMCDFLTGIMNRRSFIEMAEREINRSKRYLHPLSLALFDIDNFKDINDNFGHQAGDHVLKEMTSLVSTNIRDNDLFARWGGEEFILLSPESKREEMCQLVEKLRLILESKQYEEIGTVTSSFGVAEYIEGEGLDQLTQRADKAMYRAKKEGRNCVRIAKHEKR